MVKTKLLKNEEKRNWIYGISFVLQALKNTFIRIEKMGLLSKIETNRGYPTRRFPKDFKIN